MEKFDNTLYLTTGNELPENSSEITLPSLQTGIARFFVINDNTSFDDPKNLISYIIQD